MISLKEKKEKYAGLVIAVSASLLLIPANPALAQSLSAGEEDEATAFTSSDSDLALGQLVPEEELSEISGEDEEEEDADESEESSSDEEDADAGEESSADEEDAQSTWDGPVLDPFAGTVMGPSGKETYYNMDMSGVIEIMRSMGNTDEYHVSENGCKMLGDYIMCAANLDVHPRGSLVQSSLGMCIVCDTGGFAEYDPYQLDIAVTW